MADIGDSTEVGEPVEEEKGSWSGFWSGEQVDDWLCKDKEAGLDDPREVAKAALCPALDVSMESLVHGSLPLTTCRRVYLVALSHIRLDPSMDALGNDKRVREEHLCAHSVGPVCSLLYCVR